MKPAIILHGGAGSWRIDRRRIDKGLREIRTALYKGWNILERGGSAIDSVVETLKYMEDTGIFNAGIGSCLNLLGYREMDAGVMDGSSHLIGAVANVRCPRHPVELARYVMEHTDHIIIGGGGADLLAEKLGLEKIPRPPSHIIERYKEIKDKVEKLYGERFIRNLGIFKLFEAGDTVGAVAIDKNGNIASAVSTGGIWLKLPGRIGDSPIPGAGFYATKSFGIASTGFGEIIIENMPGVKIEHMIDNGMTLKEAMAEFFSRLKRLNMKDNMGLIGVDSSGNIEFTFDTKRMMIAYKNMKGERVALLERD